MPTQTQNGSAQGATWTTAFVNSLPNSSFAFISEDGKTRKLPYKDADGKVDLPHVRNALARLNQTQGIPDEEKTKIRTKLQNALKSAKADGLDANSFHLTQTHSLIANSTATVDLENLPTKVMLLRSGEFDPPKYWPFSISADDLTEMKDNFELGIGLPSDGRTGMPIDFSHDAGGKAAAWVKGLEVEKDADGNATLFGTNIEWSTAGQAAVVGKEFKCLSADFWPRDWPSEWQSSEQSGLTAHNVIRGVALTNVPMFEGNDPMLASDTRDDHKNVQSGQSGVDFVFVNNQNKEKSMNLDQLRVKASEELNGAEGIFIAQHANELSEDERKKFGLEASAIESDEDKKKREADEKAKDDVEAANAAAAASAGSTGSLEAATSLIAAQAEQLKAMQASIEKLSGEQQKSDHEKIEAEVKTHAARGAIKADAVKPWTKMVEAADTEGRKMLMGNLSALASNPLLGRTFGSQKTEGGAALDIEAEISKKVSEALAAAQAKGDKLDAFSARKQILAADQDLAARSTQAARAAVGNFNPFEAAWGSGAKGLQGVNPEVTATTFSS